MNVQIIVYDLDGTLRRTSGEISPETQKVLKKSQSFKTVLIPCSGRLPNDIARIHRKNNMDIPYYIVGCNGATITSGSKVVLNQSIPNNKVVEILQCYRNLGGDIGLVRINSGGHVISQEDDRVKNFYRTRNEEDFLIQVPDILNFVSINSSTKIIFCLLKDELQKLEQIFLNLSSNLLSIHRTGETKLGGQNLQRLEINANGIDKGKALKFLIEDHMAAVSPNIIAFGDAQGDMPMLKYAMKKGGTGVLVSNADLNVKEEAKNFAYSIGRPDAYIEAPTNDEDGVAAVLKELLNL